MARCAWDVAGRSWVKLRRYQLNSQLSSERADRCREKFKTGQYYWQVKFEGVKKQQRYFVLSMILQKI